MSCSGCSVLHGVNSNKKKCIKMLLGKQSWQDPGLRTDLVKRDLGLYGVNINKREIFARVCCVRQKESTSATWILKMYPTIKRFGKL